MGTHRRLDGGVHFLLTCHVDSGDDVAVVVGHDLLDNVAGEDFLTVDDAWNFDHFGGLTLEFGLEFGSLLAAGQIAEHRFVDGGGGLGDAVDHGDRS